MRALKQRKISQQRRRRKMLGRKLMPRLRRALQAGRVVKPPRDPHPWTVTPMEPSSVGTFSMSTRARAGVSARASRQDSTFPTFSGEQATVDGDFEEDQDASESGQEWSDGGPLRKKRKQRRQCRTTVAESDQPCFEEYESSSEGGGDSRGSEDDGEEDVSLDGASDDDQASGSSGSATSAENDNADACSRRDVHRLLLESQNLLQDYEDDNAACSSDDQGTNEEDSTANTDMDNTFRVFMAAGRVVVLVRPPAVVRLMGRAQLRVLHGIVDIEGHVVIGGAAAARIRPDSCLVHSPFPYGFVHIRPLPLEVPRSSGKATHLRRTLARLGMDEAWTKLRPLIAHGTAIMLLEKVPGGNWPIGAKSDSQLKGPLQSLGFQLSRDEPSKSQREPWRRRAAALARHLTRNLDFGDHQRTVKPEGRAVPCIVVCGRQNTGKSSLLRVLTNSLLNFCSEVLYLDCDPGQCEFTPPATVSLTRVTEPLLGPPYTHVRTPEKAYFLGHVSPASQPDSYCTAIRTLIDHARKVAPRAPLLVNTMGWVNGLGLSLLVDVIRWLCPTDLVQLVTKAENGETPLPALDETLLRSACGWVTSRNGNDGLWPLDDLSCYMLPGSKFRGRSTARAKREAMVLAYLGRKGSADGYHLPDTPYWLWNTTPLRVPWCAMAVHDCDNSVPKKDLLYALRGNVVALCVVPVDKMLETENPSYPKFIDSCGPYECLGYGLVRAIDPSEHLFYIATPEPSERLSEVNALIRGDLHLPESLLTAQTQLLQCGWAPYLAKASSEPDHCSDEEERNDDDSCS
uniref:Polynucleotide 5'-hydroxyl-kinase GRC3/NOL9 n=1 Tax=Rhipicephalus zambeziensis TaxID=60191 RepID=A0A224YW57_9ACAR